MGIYNFLSTLPNIDTTQITQCLNIAFFAIVAIIVLGGIVGLIRGVWSSGFRLIFVGILVILSYILAGTLGTAVANINLASFNIPSFTIGENVVEVTTIKETLVNALAAYGAGEGGDVQKILDDPNTVKLITELALMIVRLLTFIILAIIVIVVGNLLATILYHVLFKHFINKNLRKKVKLRLVGFAFGLVKTSMVASMLIVPFSGLLNSISVAFKNASDENNEVKLDSELYNQLKSWIDAYDGSMLAQGLFGWTELGGKTMDMRLLDIITSDKDSTMKLSEEMSNITTVAATLIGTNAVSVSGGECGTVSIGVNAAVFLDSKITSTLLSVISSSALCTQLLPIAATFAFNMDEINVYFDAKEYDLSKIDWKNDLESINEIFKGMSNAGIIDEDVIDNPSILIDRIYDVNNENTHRQLIESFKTFDKLTSLEQLLPSYLYTLVSKGDELSKSLSDYLPTNSEDYDGIKWGSELANIYDATYRINKVTENAIVDYIKSPKDSNNETSKIRNIRKEDNTDDKSTKLINSIVDHIGDIIPIFVGEREDGEPINVDDNGFTLEKDSAGNALQSCLLDSRLLSRSINKILNTISKMAVNALSDALKIDTEEDKTNLENKVTNAVTSIKGVTSVKKELGALFDVVNDVVSDENLLPLIKGGNDKIEFTDEVCDALKTPVSKISKSNILNATIPTVIEYTVKQNGSSLNDSLKNFGITTDSLNFEVDDIGEELSLMLDAIPAINRIAKTSKDGKVDFKNIETPDLNNILSTVYSSNILNPNKEGEVRNFFKIIDKVFSDLGYDDGRITEGLEEDKYWSGNNSEINQFCEIFDILKKNNFFDLSNNKDAYLDSTILKPESIEELFGEVDKSKLLSKGLGTILDNLLLDSLSSVTGDKVSFKYIDNWASEGENFANVIDSLQKFNSKGISLDKIDFLNSTEMDEESGKLLTEKLVSSLADSNIFENGAKGFGDFLFDKLKSISDIKMNDIDKSGTGELTYTKSEEIFDSINDWQPEIDVLFEFIKKLQTIGAGNEQPGSKGIQELMNNPSNHSDLFKVINKSEAFRMPIANGIYDAANKINISSLPTLNIKNNINIDALVNMDNYDERNDEIQTICNIIDNVNDLKDIQFNDIKTNSAKRETLKVIMENIHNSKMFNKPIEEGHVTVFENLIETLLSVADINDDVICGKINGLTNLKYNTAIEIIQNIPNNYVDKIDVDDKWIGENGEIANIIRIIGDISELDLNNIDLANIDLTKNTLLEDLNNSKLLFRALPYYINQFASKTDTSGFSSEFDLKALKADYTFNKYSGEYDCYDESEINTLKTIFNKYSIIKDLVGSSSNLNTIKGKTSDVSELLKALSTSEVFNSTSSVSGKDTVFIQVIEEMFTKSKLDEAIYDDSLFDYQGLTIKQNAQNKIKGIDNWNSEIDNLINIINVLPESFNTLNDMNVSNISPNEVIEILKTINDSELCYDAVPKYIKEAFIGINIGQFSNNQEDYLMKHSGDYRNLYSASELDVLKNMLNTLYDQENNQYMKFDDSFKVTDFAKQKSLTNIVAFLTNSKIFKGCRGEVFYNAIDSAGFSSNIREKDSSKWKVFDDLFDLIEVKGQNQINREGACLDSIVGELEDIINASNSGSNTLKSIPHTTVRKVFDACYLYAGVENKALLSCEIVSGFLSNAIVNSNYLDNDYYDTLGNVKNEWFNAWYYDGTNDYQYPLFNKLEADTLESIIDVINGIDEITFDASTQTSTLSRTMLDKIDTMFDKMKDENSNQSIIGLALYEKAIYNSLMVSNPGICELAHISANSPIPSLNYFDGKDALKQQFENNYSLMLQDDYKDAGNTNFDFTNVKDAVHAMLDAILQVKGL